MSGGARNERRHKQAAAQARLAAAGITVPPSKLEANRIPLIVTGAVVAIAVMAAVVGYVLWTRPVTPTYGAVAGADGVVTAGRGPVAVDLYEDFLCPGCRALDERDGNALTTALNDGKVTVRFHMLGFLDSRTNPPGYSTRAADASLCAAAAGIYGPYRQKLFADQPAEGSAGLTDDQLVAFGTELGATGDFAGCVKGSTHDAAIASATEAARASAPLKTNGTFGTPTIVVGGTRADLNDADWLTRAIGGR